MTPERIKEILNKGFKISNLDSENPKYKEFVSRVLKAQEITIKNNLTFAIKLELIVDAGVKFFIQPFGMTADTISHAHYSASHSYNVVPSDWDKYNDDDLAKLLAQQVADVYKNTISKIRQRKFRKHLQKEDTFQLENLSRKQAHELDINRRFNKAAPPLIIREIPVDGLDFNNLSIEDKQAYSKAGNVTERENCLARLKKVLKNDNCRKEFKAYWHFFKTLSSKQQLKQEGKSTLTTEIETITLSK